MKKFLLIALLLTFATGTAIAQPKGGPGAPSGGQGNSGTTQIERLTDQLGLDGLQAEKISYIFEEAQLLRDEERAKIQLIMDEQRIITHELILEVLTADQQVLFEELQQRRDELQQALKDMGMSRGGAGGGFGSGPGTGECSG